MSVRMYAWKYLQKLCQFPHRGSATEEEAKAAQMIKAEMSGLGFEVEEQHFLTPRDCLYLLPLQSLVPLCVIGLVGLLFGAALEWGNLLLAGLVLIMIIPLLLEVFGSSVEINLFPKHPSANIVAYTEKDFSKKCTIVVTGHYDTQKGSYLFAPWFVKHTQAFFNLVYASIGLLLLSLLVQPFFAWSRVLLWVAVVMVFVATAFLLICQLTGRYTQGANDNGTGTALTMALAQHYMENRANYPADVNFIFLLTGSEEVGSKGMKHFLKVDGRELSPERTDFLVLDNIGAGKITYLLGEGMIKVIPYHAELLEIARRLQSEYPEGTILTQPNLLLPTDSLPPISQGYRSISFLGKDESGNLGNYHWHTDRIENVDRELVEFAEGFFLRYVQELAGRRTNLAVRDGAWDENVR